MAFMTTQARTPPYLALRLTGQLRAVRCVLDEDRTTLAHQFSLSSPINTTSSDTSPAERTKKMKPIHVAESHRQLATDLLLDLRNRLHDNAD